MELSKQLLKESKLYVRQLAEYLNFEMPNYFPQDSGANTEFPRLSIKSNK